MGYSDNKLLLKKIYSIEALYVLNIPVLPHRIGESLLAEVDFDLRIVEKRVFLIRIDRKIN
jgi:hypothetical protein